MPFFEIFAPPFSQIQVRHCSKINSELSSWEESLFGVPQRSILGPLLFNIFLCRLFCLRNGAELANYADDNTPFLVSDDLSDVTLK